MRMLEELKKKKKTVATLAQTTLNKLKGEMRIRPLKQRPSLRQHSHGGRAERIYFKVALSRGSRRKNLLQGSTLTGVAPKEFARAIPR